MPPAEPRRFYWVLGIWAGLAVLGILLPGVPPGGPEPILLFGYWLAAIGAALIGWAIVPTFWRWYSQPVLFRAAEGSEPHALPSSAVPPVPAFVAVVCCGVAAFLLGGLPFSPALQLAAGLRTRTITFQKSVPAPEDFRPADIYLLPVNRFPEAVAAHFAAELRRETGLLIAALPPLAATGIEFDKTRRQVVIESLAESVNKRASTLQLPSPPRPHAPLVVALFEEDSYSRMAEWRFVLSSSFTPATAAVCTARLNFALPLDDDEARRVLALRAKKLILRLIAFHCLGEPRTNDPQSLTGATLRGIEDLDRREDRIRIPGRR